MQNKIESIEQKISDAKQAKVLKEKAGISTKKTLEEKEKTKVYIDKLEYEVNIVLKKLKEKFGGI